MINESGIYLDNLVSEIASKYFQQEGRDVTKNLQKIVSFPPFTGSIFCQLYINLRDSEFSFSFFGL